MNIYFTNGTWAGKLVVKGIIIVEALAAAVFIIHHFALTKHKPKDKMIKNSEIEIVEP